MDEFVEAAICAYTVLELVLVFEVKYTRRVMFLSRYRLVGRLLLRH